MTSPNVQSVDYNALFSTTLQNFPSKKGIAGTKRVARRMTTFQLLAPAKPV